MEENSYTEKIILKFQEIEKSHFDVCKKVIGNTNNK